ncbi:MAG: DUF4430 domain-containing protein [Ruminococcaceae bacterium]|nr:DUF4430 domain-containing protein [Oscillospiraceae bacterium]
MKNVMNSKVVLSILALVLIVAMAFSFSACGNNDSDANTTTTTQASGEAKKELSFVFKVVDLDGSEKSFDIKTEAKTVGEALVAEKLISGTEGDYGLMVDTVNGIKYDYTADGAYWAFYIDGEMAMTGVDSTDVVDGATYSFVATKA